MEPTQSILALPVLQDLQEKLKEVTLQMEQLAKQGKYVLAQNCRANAQKLKKQLDTKKVVEVEKRQKKENKDVKRFLKDQLVTFNTDWDQKIGQFEDEGKKQINEMKQKHDKELQDEKKTLEEEIPVKCKDSSEVLNLRKIQENMAKQQNYVEAHKVQKLVKQLEKKQQDAWATERDDKIDTGIQQLKDRQGIEIMALQKRIESGLWELKLQRSKAEAKLTLKHSNVSKQLNSHNKKECLATKGELKSRIDVLSPTKSRVTSPNTRSKLHLFMTR